MNIKIDDMQANAKPKKNHGTLKYGWISIVSHLALVGILFSGAFLSNSIIVDEGDDSIKAMMVDLSQIAAPEQSLVENTPEIKGAENSEIIDNKISEDTPNDTASDSKVEPDLNEPLKEDKIEPIPEKVAEVPVKETIVKPIEKSRPKPKKAPVQKASRQQVRQEVASDNLANAAVAPKISDNRQFSNNPSPISRNQPEYPRRALDMRLEGHVVVRYDVSGEGRVENIRIVESTPSTIFNRSVIIAMKGWKYKPVPAKDLTIKIIFNLNKPISFSQA